MYVHNNAVNMKLKKWTKCFWKKAGIRRCNNVGEQDLSNERLLFQFSGSMQTIRVQFVSCLGIVPSGCFGGLGDDFGGKSCAVVFVAAESKRVG